MNRCCPQNYELGFGWPRKSTTMSHVAVDETDIFMHDSNNLAVEQDIASEIGLGSNGTHEC